MEHTLTHPIFVEFYGLPGSGKSTVSNIVAQWLRVDGYIVDEPSYKEDHRPAFQRKIRKLLIGCLWALSRKASFKSVSRLVAENGYKGFEKFTQTVNVLQKLNVYWGKTDRIVLWDQGIFQAAVSLSIKGKLSAFDNLQKIMSFLPDDVFIQRVYIPVEFAVSLVRMESRKTKDSRVDRLEGEENKLNMLRTFETGIESIRNSYTGGDSEIIAGKYDKLEVIIEYVYNSLNNEFRKY